MNWRSQEAEESTKVPIEAMPTRNIALTAFMFAILTVALTLTSCAGPSTTLPTPTGLETPTETVLVPTVSSVPDADLSHLSEALSIYLQDDWTGLSPWAPISAHYRLARQNGGLIGKANFSVAGYSNGRTAVADIRIPVEVTQRFLAALSQSSTKYGYYAPPPGGTDSYPSLLIEVTLKDETIKFYSSAQTKNHAPWGVDQLGNTFVIDSDQPTQALALLEPYLKKDVLTKLENEPGGMPTTGTPDSQP